jgi:hypothetical protein
MSWEEALTNYKVLLLDNVAPATDFIRACLHLDPAQRPKHYRSTHLSLTLTYSRTIGHFRRRRGRRRIM